MRRPTMSRTNVPGLISALTVLTLALSACTRSPAPARPAVEAASSRLPVDSAYHTGRLDNGFTYYIRSNHEPEKRAELWLAVNTGSVLEDDDQRGLAHFVEHMAFNGTRSFRKQEIVNYLESIGMRFGPDINAYTDFDETVYTLTVPTDDPQILAKAFQILQEWAEALSFDPAEVEKERGVVIEEWRLGRGAPARIRDRQLPVLLKGSRYAERLPIGDKKVIETASPDVLRRFYVDWYRPDLMAVVAVGDFDSTHVEAAIRERFSGLAKRDNPRQRPSYPVPDQPGTLVAVATDPEATASTVSISHKLPKRDQSSESDYRRLLLERLYRGLVNARLLEIAQSPDAPFLAAFTGMTSFVRSCEMLSEYAQVREGGLLRGLEALTTEVERVDRHGFTAGELERAKKELLRTYEQGYAERDKTESAAFAREAASNFLEGEPMPGIAAELALVRRFLPGIALADVNTLAQGALGENNRVVLMSAPAKAGLAVPDEAEVLAAVRAVAGRSIEPWVDRVRNEPLVVAAPAPGQIVEESKIPELGVSEWKLSNGIRVVLKPTIFKNDQILLTGFSPGGTSLVADPDYSSAQWAATLMEEGGLGQFSKVELQKALAGKMVRASAYIGELEEGVDADASPADAETMFELVELELTAPRVDEQAFQAWKGRIQSWLQNRLARPEAAFNDKVTLTIWQGHPRRQPPSIESLSKVDLGVAAKVYRDRFADCGDLTIVIVGTIEPEKIKPMVLTWLGSLPSGGSAETWKDVGARTPEGVVRFEVRKGIEPKSQVRMTFSGDAEWSRQSEHDMRSLGEALRIRMREVLREDLGGVYGVGVGGAITKRPVEQYTFSISFGCAPERVAELEKAVFDVVESFKKDGVPADIITKVREAQTRQHEIDLKDNGFWLSALADSYRYRTDPRLILAFDELVKSVTSERLQEAARRYLRTERYVVGELYPESAAP